MKKKNFFLTAALAVAAVAIVTPVDEVSAKDSLITDTVYIINNQSVALSFDYFTEALNADVLSDLAIKYLKLSDGNYYDFDTVTSAINAFSSLDEAVTYLMSDSKLSTKLTNVIPGKVDQNGHVAVKEENQVKVFSVESIK